MGVVHSEGDEGSSGGKGEVGGKVVRVLLGGSDGSGGSIKVHVAGGVEGLHGEGDRPTLVSDNVVGGPRL